MYKVMHLFDNSNITNKFSKSELTVYQYIQNNIDDIAQISAEKLAEITFTSPATINRMAKKLGTEGFSHLKHMLLDDIKIHQQHEVNNRTLTDTTNLLSKINFVESINLAQKISRENVLFIDRKSVV